MSLTLTGEQRRAIAHDGRHLQLIACAGSGKTEVVARHVAALLANGARPANIVAFTFTEKAAGELKGRIVERCHEQVPGTTGLAEMFVGTIHAFCLDLLKTEVAAYLKYDVLNDVQQTLFVDRHSKSSGLTQSTTLLGDPLRRYTDTRRYIQALAILREETLDEHLLAGNSVRAGLDAYLALLHERGYLDYSGIMHLAARELERNEGLRERLRERVRHVIVDEYQDVNPIQERVVAGLAALGARLVVVGDDDQTIYQWRGSDVHNIITFAERYPDVEPIRLEENYRSSRGIVESARDFIAQNHDRLPKAMQTTDAHLYEEGDLVALSFASPEEEAAFVVSTIQDLHGLAFADGEGGVRGLAYSDMAVLLRSVKGNGEPITAALQAADIPFIVGGMATLFETGEAQAARALFQFMGDTAGVDARSVERAWLEADLGLDPAKVRAAVADAARARDDFAGVDVARFRLYGIQRKFLDFLESVELREERVPNGRGDVVFYNLGKFSQVISDFESIHWRSRPAEKYQSFAKFLVYQAPQVYGEGEQDNAHASPNAVRIMTAHQAKGLEWPVVFIPALLRNRFPSAAIGGPSVWNLIPRSAVADVGRYDGSLEDERRLFYVAMTRSQKFLFLTWAPIAGKNNRYVRPSAFWDDVLASHWVKRRQFSYDDRARAESRPRASIANVVLSFSELKYFFECPYQFKLRVLYGFNAPLHEALGYGKSLHDALADINTRAIHGDYATLEDAGPLVATHLRAPYAFDALLKQLHASAERIVADYIRDNAADFKNIEYSEKGIEIDLGDGVSVTGRIDLVRRRDTNETFIVDFKTRERVQSEEVTEDQLNVYALGYQELTGREPEYVEVYDLDERRRKPRSVDNVLVDRVKARVREAANALRHGDLPPRPVKVRCESCDFRRMCSGSLAATHHQ